MSTRTAFFSLFVLPLLGAASCGDPATAADGRADAGVDVEQRPPLANVFVNNPLDDHDRTTVVELQHITDPTGKLTGAYVDTWNCVNSQNGDQIKLEFSGIPITGRLCELTKSVTPQADGTYLHVTPAAGNDGSDPFAEVMMYHHVTAMHDFFKDRLGVEHMDHPLRAIVNLQVFLPMLGGWIGMTNAAFIPKETGDLVKTLYGIDITAGQDSMLFSQGDTVDTAYDASVIYHEYTHAMIGDRLFAGNFDAFGSDPTPIALNEALADYFAASKLDNDVIGRYTLGPAARDLTRVFRCPEHIVGEPHRDGEVASGALWELRRLVGRDIADQTLINALLAFTSTTGFEEGATAILDELAALAPTEVDAVERVFRERGLIGCTRLVDHRDYDVSGDAAALAPGYPANNARFAEGAPAYLQQRIRVRPGVRRIVIEWRAEGTSTIPGAGGPPGVISVALKRGVGPITYDYGTSPATSSADTVLAGVNRPDGTGRIEITGSCVRGGPLVFQLLNKSNTPGQIRYLRVTQSPEPGPPTAKGSPWGNYTGCRPR